MKLRTTDMEKIRRMRCEEKGCKNDSYGIYHSEYLCESHFKAKKGIVMYSWRDTW